MDTTRKIPRTLVLGAVAVGVAAGSYGVAAAATGSGSPSTTTTTVPSIAPPARTGGPPAGHGWGTGQRSDETPLTGDALAKVTAVAKDKVPGGTVVRVETDADGDAAYEAHMTDASGNQVTVYVDKDFHYVSTGRPF